MEIRDIKVEDKNWLIDLVVRQWGSTKIVTKGNVFEIGDLQGFIAEENNNRFGVLTYNVNNNECEIITLNVIKHNKGIGTLLLQELIKKAKNNGWIRIWAITTNDNLIALRFYQKKGFTLKAIYPNAIEESRKLKPEIPLIGENEIPIRDEIEVEFKVS